jgi:beta-alanine--pyruvate transaminase
VDIQSDGVPGRRGHLLQKQLFDAGLHLKTTGDCAILSPQFIFEREHIDKTVEIVRSTLASFEA